MDTYIVRQPILNRQQKVVAYEILYKQAEDAARKQQDVWVANVIEGFLERLNDKTFLENKEAFLTFTPNLLMRNIPKMFRQDQLVIQIENDSITHPVAQKIVYRFKKQGYKIALNNFEPQPKYFAMMDAVDIIKIDFQKEIGLLRQVVEIAHDFKKLVAAYNLDTQESLELARELECDYYQGLFVAEQKKSKAYRLDHLQSNFFQLMVAVTKDEPDIDEITKIISRDVTLAFSLMKLVNSAYFALKNQVKSVQQALMILGLGQLKQWIYLLSFRSERGGIQEEIIKMSFLRANFCMELAKLIENLPISPSEAYLMGMFSTLGILMEVPLETVLDELPLSNEIKQALEIGEGKCGSLYHLVLSYEKADWQELTLLAQKLGIPENQLTQVYFDCIEQVNQIWQELQQPMDTLS